MIPRDLIRLPLGNYHITDGISNYKLIKKVCDDGMIMYRVTSDFDGQHFCLFENIEPVFEDQAKPTAIRLSSLMTVGLFSVHSNDVWTSLGYLKIIKRGSFSEFCKRTIK